MSRKLKRVQVRERLKISRLFRKNGKVCRLGALAYLCKRVLDSLRYLEGWVEGLLIALARSSSVQQT